MLFGLKLDAIQGLPTEDLGTSIAPSFSWRTEYLGIQ
jgi:hypothetical protein